MQLIFEQIRLGGDRNFGYLLGDRDRKEGVLIDPAYSPETLVERARAQDLAVTHVVNTHGHPDHVNGNEDAVEATGAPVAGHPSLPKAPEVPLGDGDELSVGSLRLRVLETPGHADDHLVLYEPTHEILVTGDLIFVGRSGAPAPRPMAGPSGRASRRSSPPSRTRRRSGRVTTTASGRAPPSPWSGRRTPFSSAATPTTSSA